MMNFDHFSQMFLGLNILLIIGISLIGLVIYFLPSVLAVVRHKKQTLAIFVINLFLGWTAVGWLAALIWAAIKEQTDGIKARTTDI
jgi:hypothetical protein